MSSPAAARLPASIRNHNPGAMYPGPVSKRFGSTSFQVLKSKDGTHKIATFATDIQGAAAQFYLLGSPAYADGKRTVRQAIEKWCGGFYVSTYLRVLEEQAGVSRDARLTRAMICNPDVAIPLARAMAWQEAGRDYPLEDEGWRQAHALAIPTAAKEVAAAAGDEASSAPPAPASSDADGWDRSQRSKPETRVQEAAAQSGTLRAALVGLWMWLLSFLNDITNAVSGALDTAQHLLGDASPLGMVASAAKVSTKELFIFVGIGAALGVIAKRFKDAEEGQ